MVSPWTRRSMRAFTSVSAYVILIVFVCGTHSSDESEEMRRLSLASAQTASIYGLSQPAVAVQDPASDMSEGGSVPGGEEVQPPSASRPTPGDGSATEKLKTMDKEVAADLAKQEPELSSALESGQTVSGGNVGTAPVPKPTPEPKPNVNTEAAISETPGVVGPPKDTITQAPKGATVLGSAAQHALGAKEDECEDTKPAMKTLNSNGGKSNPSGDGTETEKLRKLDTEIVSEARANKTSMAPTAQGNVTKESQPTEGKSKCMAGAGGKAITPEQDDAVTAEEDEENLKDRERRARNFVMESWARDLRDTVHENFAYHDISHAFLFAEHVTKYTDDLAMKVIGFVGGLYHDAALSETTKRGHYNLLCNVDTKASFVATSTQRQLGLQVKVGGKNVHPDHTKGYETLSICRALQLLKKVAQSESTEEVVTDIKWAISPERIHWLVAAMAHTNVRYINEGTNPLKIQYSKSMTIKKDIVELIGAKGANVDLSEGSIECDALPLGEWIPEMNKYWDGIVNDEESDTAVFGQADMNNAFHNAVYLHYGEKRGLCAAASELNEVMSYEGLVTHNPIIGSSYELVLRHLYGKSEAEIKKLKDSTSAVGPDGEMTPWMLYDDFTVILIAYFQDQVSYVKEWVHFRIPLAKKHSDMIDGMNRMRIDNVKALQATRDKLIRMVFPQITDEQIQAWEVLHNKEPYSPQRLEELRDDREELRKYMQYHDSKNKEKILERVMEYERTMVSFRSLPESCDATSAAEEACNVGPNTIQKDGYLRLLTEEWAIGGSNAVQSKGPTCSFQRVPVVMESNSSTFEVSVWSGRLSQNPIMLPPEISPLSEEHSICKEPAAAALSTRAHAPAKASKDVPAHLRKA